MRFVRSSQRSVEMVPVPSTAGAVVQSGAREQFANSKQHANS